MASQRENDPELVEGQGRLAQLVRALHSHCRGHRFESCSDHHSSFVYYELRMAGHSGHFVYRNEECPQELYAKDGPMLY